MVGWFWLMARSVGAESGENVFGLIVDDIKIVDGIRLLGNHWYS